MAQLVDISAESDVDVTEVLDISSDEELPTEPGAPPRRFQEYRRGQELGRGASGAVFTCRRDYCRGRFAVKAIDLRRMRLGANAERQQMLLSREVEILRTLPPHPNIVRLVDAFEEGPWFLMVLERVCGGDLFSVLTARSPPQFLDAEAAHVTRQVAEGLAFLHRQGVIHRDLKLENVLVASERREPPLVWYDVKITDFGLSKDVTMGASGAHSLVGTRPYTAPEVELKSYGMSSDIWCLGILVFIMLMGRFPFEQIPGEQSVLERMVDEMQCGEAMKLLVSGLLQLDPANRLSLSRICSEAWLEGASEGAPSGREAKRQRIEAPRAEPSTAQDCSARAERACGEPHAAEHAVGDAAQHYIRTDKHQRELILAHLLDSLDFEQAIVFTNSVQQAVSLEGLLASEGFSPLLVHPGLDAAALADRCQRFRDFEGRLLVSADPGGVAPADRPGGCTEAARLSLVVNFDAPAAPGQYLDRLGRGCRFLATGCVITFVTDDGDVAVLEEVERRFRVNVSAMLAKVNLDSDARL